MIAAIQEDLPLEPALLQLRINSKPILKENLKPSSQST
jgi:hypothetical protein